MYEFQIESYIMQVVEPCMMAGCSFQLSSYIILGVLCRPKDIGSVHFHKNQNQPSWFGQGTGINTAPRL